MHRALQARMSSEAHGLPCRRHFPWNLILLAIFVSDWGELGTDAEWGQRKDRGSMGIESLNWGYQYKVLGGTEVSNLSPTRTLHPSFLNAMKPSPLCVQSLVLGRLCGTSNQN